MFNDVSFFRSCFWAIYNFHLLHRKSLTVIVCSDEHVLADLCFRINVE